MAHSARGETQCKVRAGLALDWRGSVSEKSEAMIGRRGLCEGVV